MPTCKFHIGDQVKILPSWFDKLASGKNAQLNHYVQRGSDFVYTVKSHRNRAVYLEEGSGTWDEDKLIFSWEDEPDSNVDLGELL